MTEQDVNKPGLNPQTRFVIRRIMRFLWKLTFRLAVVLMVLFLVFQLPVVQNYLLKKVTSSLNEKLGTKVEIADMHIGFLSHFSLDRVYIEDAHQDTLLYAHRIDANINLNPITLLRKGVIVNKLQLGGIDFIMEKKKGEQQNNLQFLITRLFPDKKEKNGDEHKGGFQLDIHQIFLNDVHFRKADYMRGNVLDVMVGNGDILFNNVNLPDEEIDIEWVKFDQLRLLTENHLMDSTLMNEVDTYDPNDTDTSKWKIRIFDFDITNAQYSLHNYFKAPIKESKEDELDFRHLMTYDVNVAIDSFLFDKEVFHGIVRAVSAKDSSGFVLTDLSGEDVTVTNHQTIIKGLNIETPYSHIGNHLVFNYDRYLDFQEFVDSVDVDLSLEQTSLALRDIVSFAPALKDNRFFTKNRETKLDISGRIKGIVNAFKASNLSIALPDGSVLEGKLKTRDVTVRDEENFNLKLKKLETTVQTLHDLIPNFHPDPKFDNMGKLNFKGRFDGFLNDFVSDGVLVSNVGTASMNMRVDTKEGLTGANYSGDLELQSFDLGRLFENPDIGIVNFRTEVVNGKGLTLNSADADLSAEIKDFYYKGYQYRNAVLVGKLQKNLFDGDFSIRDDNINFTFKGEIDMKGAAPRFKFKADIANLDFYALNLSKKDLSLSGKVNLNLKNKTLANLTGKVLLNDLIIKKDDVKYNVDQLVAFSSIDTSGRKSFLVKSDVINAAVFGQFNVEKLHTSFLSFFQKNYPEFVDHLNLKLPKGKLEPYDFSFDISVLDSKGLNWLIDDKLGVIQDLTWKGYYSVERDSMSFMLDLPKLTYDQIDFYGINSNFSSKDSLGRLSLEVVEVHNNEKPLLPQINFLSSLKRDTMNFQLNYAAADTSDWDNVSLTGALTLPPEGLFQLKLDPSNLVFLENIWDIDPKNKIVWRKDTISFSDFSLTNNINTIKLSDNGVKGVAVEVDSLNFNLIDKYWDYEQLDFEGNFSARLMVDDVFTQKDLFLSIEGDTFLINHDYYGNCHIELTAPDVKSRIDAHLLIQDNDRTLEAKGFYNIKGPKGIHKIPYAKREKYLDFTLDVNNYPLAFSEYFIAPGVKNVVGDFKLQVGMKGFFPNPEITGFIRAKDAAFTIDYLKTRYSFNESYVKVSNYLFDVSGTVIKDKYGHSAVLEGGITHEHLRDLGVNARLFAERFLALETTKEDNGLYYGHALGTGMVEFQGPLKSVDIYVNATVSDSTHIVMPIGTTAEASVLNNVRFVNKHKKNQKIIDVTEFDAPEGVSFEMDLSIEDEAIMELVFDEKAGDIIRGQGRGNIRMSVPYGEDFKMYGDFNIEKGSYLFTKYLLNKDFDVRRGGTIQWSGDPFGAQISIDAKYNKLKTPLYNFIADDLGLSTDPDLLNDANKSTEVDLTLHLKGELFKPIISFDIDFPSLTGSMQSIVNNKMRLISSDPNELNKQVFGLIMLGQFLPPDVAIGNTGTAFSNTLSEFLSNQFSVLVTNWLSEAFDDNEVFSDLNFDMAYNSYDQSDFITPQGGFNRGSDFQISFSKSFFDDRFSFSLGGSVNDYEGIESSGTFIGDNVVLEYIINKNRTLRLRVYHKVEPDISGRAIQRAGAGLRYRKEFNSFADFFKSFNKEAKKVKKK